MRFLEQARHAEGCAFYLDGGNERSCDCGLRTLRVLSERAEKAEAGLTATTALLRRVRVAARAALADTVPGKRRAMLVRVLDEAVLCWGDSNLERRPAAADALVRAAAVALLPLLAQTRKALYAISDYAQHGKDCAILDSEQPAPCDCGYDAADSAAADALTVIPPEALARVERCLAEATRFFAAAPAAGVTDGEVKDQQLAREHLRAALAAYEEARR